MCRIEENIVNYMGNAAKMVLILCLLFYQAVKSRTLMQLTTVVSAYQDAVAKLLSPKVLLRELR